MDLPLNGRRAVVTVSSAGIGEAIARRLAAEGAAVIVHGRRSDAIDAVVEGIRSAGGQAKLPPSAQAELDTAMREFLPGAPLTWMIGLGADAVAAELAAI